MRSLLRQRQKVWFSKIEEKLDGIDTVLLYSKPIMYFLTVSATAGTSEEIAAGLIPSYDRYVTSFQKLPVIEGMAVWVDVVPELDESGNLVMSDDGVTPITPPDYTLKRILDTKKGDVARYGIVKIKETK